jgi:hypothetical protein
MRVRKTTKRCAEVQIEGIYRSGRKAWRRDHPACIIEADQPDIERGVSERRQEKTVVDVEPFRIALALRPWDDVRCAQQRRVGDTSERAAALPVIHQAGAENVLADPLHHQPLDLGCLGQIRHAKLEFAQRRVGQADT